MSGCGCEQVDRLAAILRRYSPRLVHADEVAVLLESTGFTDRAAERGYRQSGLFALARQVLRRLGPPARRAPAFRWDWAALGGVRLLAARAMAAVAFGAVGWRWGPLAVLPALVTVPLGELLVAWYGGEVRWAVGRFDEARAVARHLAGVGRRALLALVPPLLAATGLATAAGYLPAGFALAHLTAQRAAIGCLLAGWYPLLLLLATCRRLAVGLGVFAVLTVSWAPIVGYLLGLVVAAAGLSTGPFRRRADLRKVLSRAVRRPVRLEEPPRDPARPAARRA